MEFSDSKIAKSLLGGVNTSKYGKSVYYLLGALNVTSKAYFRRLVPSDATYANIVIDKNKMNDVVEYLWEITPSVFKESLKDILKNVEDEQLKKLWMGEEIKVGNKKVKLDYKLALAKW